MADTSKLLKSALRASGGKNDRAHVGRSGMGAVGFAAGNPHFLGAVVASPSSNTGGKVNTVSGRRTLNGGSV